MNVIIIGCTKTGARLANELDEKGYDVAIVEQDEQSFSLLSLDFSGLVVCGDVTDVEVLKNAGCENANIAVVVTENDNVNVMVSQMLKIQFEIETVYTRVQDPARESVFRKFGLHTICPTRFEADILYNLVAQETNEINTLEIGENSVEFYMEKAERKHFGKSPLEIPLRDDEMIFAVRKKKGQLFLANSDELYIEDGDMLIYCTI